MVKHAGIVFIALILSACSHKIYQGRGAYIDNTEQSREILLQWKSQEYYFPFMSNEIDYGSVSLQTSCLKGGLIDYENHPQHGFILKERPQLFYIADKAARIDVGNFIVCAKLKNNQSLATLKAGDNVTLETYCVAKSTESPIIDPNPGGYALTIKTSSSEDAIDCKSD